MRKTLLSPHDALLGSLPERAPLAFAARPTQSLTAWRRRARAQLRAHLLLPDMRASASDVRVDSRHEHDGLLIEHLSWAMPWGPRTHAVFARPLGARGRLPAVLGLHDHS